MSTCVMQQRLTKGVVQFVRLALQESVNEIGCPDLIQIDKNPAELSF